MRWKFQYQRRRDNRCELRLLQWCYTTVGFISGIRGRSSFQLLSCCRRLGQKKMKEGRGGGSGEWPWLPKALVQQTEDESLIRLWWRQRRETVQLPGTVNAHTPKKKYWRYWMDGPVNKSILQLITEYKKNRKYRGEIPKYPFIFLMRCF